MPDRALIFDFDGVIVDSEPAHCRAIEAALERLGMPFPGKHDYGRYIGRGDRECFIEVSHEQGRDLSTQELDRLVSLKAAAFLDAAKGGLIRPIDGTIALLRAAAESRRVGVCSGSQRESVLPVLETLGVRELLSVVVTASDVPRNKPDPAPYLLAASRLNQSPTRCVALEDSPTGIRSARAAGYTVHGVCHSFAAERLSEAHHVHASSAGLTLADVFGP
jgi:beta-phosphoglucomutase